MHFLWKNVYASPFPILKLGCLVLVGAEFQKSCLCFYCWCFIRYVLCRYSLPFCAWHLSVLIQFLDVHFGGKKLKKSFFPLLPVPLVSYQETAGEPQLSTLPRSPRALFYSYYAFVSGPFLATCWGPPPFFCMGFSSFLVSLVDRLLLGLLLKIRWPHTCFVYCSLMSLGGRKCEYSNFFLIFQNFLGLGAFLEIPYKLSNEYLCFCHWDYDSDCIISVGCPGWYCCYCNNIKSSRSWTRISLQIFVIFIHFIGVIELFHFPV